MHAATHAAPLGPRVHGAEESPPVKTQLRMAAQDELAKHASSDAVQSPVNRGAPQLSQVPASPTSPRPSVRASPASTEGEASDKATSSSETSGISPSSSPAPPAPAV